MTRSAHNIRETPSLGQEQHPTADAYTIHRRRRFWAVLDPTGALVCITVYKCGAEEVIRRLLALPPANDGEPPTTRALVSAFEAKSAVVRAGCRVSTPGRASASLPRQTKCPSVASTPLL